MVLETPESVHAWATATFGDSKSNGHVVRRAAKEFEELQAEVAKPLAEQDVDKIVEEATDTVLVLFRLFTRNGRNFWDEVDKKMAVNRTRQWEVDGNGHGHHVSG